MKLQRRGGEGLSASHRRRARGSGCGRLGPAWSQAEGEPSLTPEDTGLPAAARGQLEHLLALDALVSPCAFSNQSTNGERRQGGGGQTHRGGEPPGGSAAGPHPRSLRPTSRRINKMLVKSLRGVQVPDQRSFL